VLSQKRMELFLTNGKICRVRTKDVRAILKEANAGYDL
jgi:hypothetical protein